MSTVTNYSPLNVTVVVDGDVIDLVADGTFVTVDYDEDQLMAKAGGYGDVVITNNQNAMGKITVTVQQTSPSNDVLTQKFAAQKASGVAGNISVQVSDIGGTSLASSTNAFIPRPAKQEFGKEASNREWTFVCPSLQVFVGGSLF